MRVLKRVAVSDKSVHQIIDPPNTPATKREVSTFVLPPSVAARQAKRVPNMMIVSGFEIVNRKVERNAWYSGV